MGKVILRVAVEELPELPVTGQQNIAGEGDIGDCMGDDAGEKVFPIGPQEGHEQTEGDSCRP